MPYNDRVDPSRAKDRKEMDEPIVVKSKIETLARTRWSPYTDSEEPQRVKDRSDTPEPMDRKSTIEIDEPNRAKP
jgi:hypothetical protein